MSKLIEELDAAQELVRRALRSRATDPTRVLLTIRELISRLREAVLELEANQKGKPGRPPSHPSGGYKDTIAD